MTDYPHPMRKAVFHAYVRQDGKEAIARAVPLALCPMVFTAPTAEEALARAEEFRAEAVAQNEAAYANRQAGLEKSRAARKAKKESQ